MTALFEYLHAIQLVWVDNLEYLPFHFMADHLKIKKLPTRMNLRI